MAGDVVWLDVLPDMGNFAGEMTRGATKAAADAGKSSGKAWATGFSSTASDGGTKTAVAELEAAAKASAKAVEDQVNKIRQARASERDATARVTLAEEALEKARAKFGETSAQAEAAEQRLEGARSRQEAAASKLQTTEDGLRAAANEHKEVTKQLADETEKAAGKTGDATGKWDSFKSALSGGKTKLDEATGSVEGMATQLALTAGAVVTFAEAWTSGLDLEKGTDKLAASLGLTAEQSETAGEVAGNLYAEAYGESMADVTGAVEAVMSSIEGMAEAAPDDLQRITEGVLNLASAFELDVGEAARNVGILIKNGLAGDATEALDLIAASLQEVPKALRGEVTEATQEYAQFFAQLGYSGAESMALLVSSTQDGQYGVDKMGDSLKELSIRATDMSKTSVEAYEAAGLNADDMAARFLAGGETAQGALQDLVGALLGIEDPTKRANAAIGLFGTPLEDLGVNEIPTFLEGLVGVEDGLGNVEGKMAEVGTTLNDNVSTGFTELKRSFVGVLAEGIQPFLEPAQAVLDWMTSVPGLLPAFAIGLGVVTVAWGVYTVAQWAANSALLAFPGTWIVLAIAAVIASIVLIAANWDTVSQALGDGWDWLVDYVFKPAGKWFGDVGEWFADMGDGIGATWDDVQGWLKDGWDWIWTFVVSPYIAAWVAVGEAFVDVGDGIGDTWDDVQDWLRAGWNWIDRYVIDPYVAAWVSAAGKFEDFGDDVGDVWNDVQDWLRSGWRWIDDHVIDPFKDGIKGVGTTFQNLPDIVDKAMDKVRTAAARPINFVISTVYMQGIRAVWNKIADAVGLDLDLPAVSPIKFAAGGVLPGYTPGKDVHRFYSPTAGSLELSGGEAIMRPEWTRAVGGPAAVARMNEQARAGRFADGGVWSWAGDAVDWLKDAGSTAVRVLTDPVGAIKDAILRPVQAMLGQVGGGALGDVVSALPGQIIDSLTTSAKGAGGGGGHPAGALGWQNMWRIVSSAFPWATLTSAYRPGAVTATGFPSYHGSGRAIDVSPSMEIFNWLASTFPNATELIYSPAGGRQLRNGIPTLFGEPTRGDHWSHIHWAMANGGVIPPLVFDEGGWLPPGRSVVENRTGRPEPLARLDVERARAGEGVATMPRVLEVRDVDGALVGRMRVEAGAVMTGRVTPMDEERSTW